MTGIEGRLEGIDGDLLYGWAFRSDQPDRPVAIEVLCDGIAIAVILADRFHRESFDQGRGLGLTGFSHLLTAEQRQLTRILEVRPANGGTPLPGRIRLRHPDDLRGSKPPPPIGRVYQRPGLLLEGWLVDPADRDAHQTIRVIEQDREIARVTADLYRPSPGLAAMVGGGDHHFRLWLPPALADGQPHLLRILGPSGAEINGSPITVCQHVNSPLLALRRARQLGDPAAMAGLAPVLEAMLADAAHFFPASLGFGHYEAWRQSFPAPSPTGETASAVVLVLDAPTPDAVAVPAGTRVLAGAGALAQLSALPGQPAGAPDVATFLRAGSSIDQAGLALLATRAVATGRPIYPDAQSRSDDGPSRPVFHPPFDPDLCLATGYALDGLTVPFAGVAPRVPQAQDPLTLALAVLLDGEDNAAAADHLPYPLLDLPAGRKPLCADPAFAAAVRARLERAAPGTLIERAPAAPDYLTFRYPLPDPPPQVSIIVPTRNRLDLLSRCIESLIERTDYPCFDVIIVDNGSDEADVLDWLARLDRSRFTILGDDGLFNFSRLNNGAVAQARGELVCLLNNDTEISAPGWLSAMVGHLYRPGIGAVGAKLLWPDDHVQHGGVVLGAEGAADHIGPDLHRDDPGYGGHNVVARRAGAVTAACLLVRKTDYLAVGGMDELQFAVNFNDVDLCLKLRERGLACLWTPLAELYHHESASRGDQPGPQEAARTEREIAALRRKWAPLLARDPHYSPNLALTKPLFGALAFPPRRDDDLQP